MMLEHSSPVWCADWSHPEYGTFLAVAGFEGSVSIYKWGCRPKPKWNEVEKISHSVVPITCVKFSPIQYCSRNGEESFSNSLFFAAASQGYDCLKIFHDCDFDVSYYR